MRGVPDGGSVFEREPLLAALEATAQRVDSTGLAAAVLLCGEPGIGKSTLLDHAVAALTADWAVLHIRGRALGSDRPYDAARPLMRRLHSLLGEDVAALDDADALEHTAIALTRVAARGPVALVVDDLHWLDAHTVDLLDYLWTEFASAPLLWLVALRRPDAERRPEVAHLLHRLERDRRSAVMDVPRLTLSAVTAMCAMTADVGPSTIARIFERSRGNPLVVDALLRAPTATVASDPGSHPIPDYVRAVYTAQFSDLLPAERDLLCAAVAVDNTLTDDVIERVLGALGQSLPEAKSATRTLLSRGLLDRPDPGTMEIAHQVVGEVAQEVFAGADLARVSAAILATVPDLLDELDAARLVEHAGDAIAADRAVDFLQLAADRAMAVSAVDAAVRWQRAAVHHAARLDPRGRSAPLARAMLRLVSQLDGTPREAVEVAERATATAMDLGDSELAVDAMLAAARARWQAGRTDTLVADMDRMCALADGRDARLGIKARLLALRLAMVADLPDAWAISLGDDCRRMALTAGDTRAAAAVDLLLRMRRMSHFGTDDWRQLQAQIDAGETGLPDHLVAMLRLEQAQLTGDLGELERLAAEPGLPPWRRLLARFEAAFLSGRWDDAQRVVDSMGPLSRHAETRALGAWLAVHRGTRLTAADDGATALIVALSALLHGELAEAQVPHADEQYLAMQEARVRATLAELQLAAGHTDEFAITMERIEAMAVPGGRMDAVSERLRGLQAASGAEMDVAMTRLQRAADINRQLGLHFEAARCELEALVLVTTQDTAQAARLGDLAAWFDDIGAAPWAQRARTCLANHPGGRSERSLLTRRESEIAGLVAQGLSNAQIAAQLYLSVRTVTSHLDHAYTKLGVGSRAALAVYVRELDRNT